MSSNLTSSANKLKVMQRRCIHCLAMSDRTRDHALPKHWYPDNTPSTIQRRTAPSCRKCNNEIGKAEDWIFVLLALCTNSNQTEAQGIHRKLREKLGIGINPRLLHGKGLVEWKRRDDFRRQILRRVSPYNPNIKHFPNLGPDSNFPIEAHVVVPVPHQELLMVSEKIIRGLEYVHDKRYVELTHKVSVHFPEATPEVLRNVDALLASAPQEDHGPGFVVKRRLTDREQGGALYSIQIWGKLKIYGTIDLNLPV